MTPISALESLINSVGRLVDQDLSYHGAEIRIPAISHHDAVAMIAEVRSALIDARKTMEVHRP